MSIRICFKSLPGTNTSLLQKFVNYGQKSFITLGPGANVIKLFCRYFTNFCNKLVFVPGKLYQYSLKLAVRPRALVMSMMTLEWRTRKVLNLGRLLPYPKALISDGKACQGQTL